MTSNWSPANSITPRSNPSLHPSPSPHCDLNLCSPHDVWVSMRPDTLLPKDPSRFPHCFSTFIMFTLDLSTNKPLFCLILEPLIQTSFRCPPNLHPPFLPPPLPFISPPLNSNVSAHLLCLLCPLPSISQPSFIRSPSFPHDPAPITPSPTLPDTFSSVLKPTDAYCSPSSDYLPPLIYFLCTLFLRHLLVFLSFISG